MPDTAFSVHPLEKSNSSSFSHSPVSVGELFVQQRERKNITLDEVSQKLCIRKVYLSAIEQQDLPALPETVYTLGFVRSYARHLGLSEQEIVDRFKNEVLKIENQENLSVNILPPEQSSPSKIWVFLSTIASLGIILLLYKNYFSSSTSSNSVPILEDITSSTLLENPSLPEKGESSPIKEKNSLPAPPSTFPESKQPINISLALNSVEKKEETLLSPIEINNPMEKPLESTSTIQSPSLPSTTVPSPVKKDPIKIIAKSRSWVEIKNSKGDVLVSKIFLPGEEYYIPENSDFILNTGNIGGLRFIVHEKELPPVNNQRSSRRNILLTPQGLMELNKEIPALPPEAKKIEKSPPKNNTLPAPAPTSSTNFSTVEPEIMPSVIDPKLDFPKSNVLSYEE
jgi:cytoskeleton protein RodZ